MSVPARSRRPAHTPSALLLALVALGAAPLAPAGPLQETHPAAVHAQSADVSALDAYFAGAQKAWPVPGLSVAIVKDGKVVLEKGYGVARHDGTQPVDEHTLYAIASNSKAFTAAALARLVDEGKLAWDDRVVDHLPWFQLYDPYVTQDMRVRDLLSHRAGLGTFSGDLLWYGTPYSAEEIVRRARHLPSAFPFRAGYGYTNLMFIAAGEVLKAAGGEDWHTAMRTRFFQPLGMTRSVTSVGDLPALARRSLVFPNYLASHPRSGRSLTFVSSDR